MGSVRGRCKKLPLGGRSFLLWVRSFRLGWAIKIDRGVGISRYGVKSLHGQGCLRVFLEWVWQLGVCCWDHLLQGLASYSSDKQARIKSDAPWDKLSLWEITQMCSVDVESECQTHNAHFQTDCKHDQTYLMRQLALILRQHQNRSKSEMRTRATHIC